MIKYILFYDYNMGLETLNHPFIIPVTPEYKGIPFKYHHLSVPILKDAL
jgi:hypothetical protein